jgi:hypothetical protein
MSQPKRFSIGAIVALCVAGTIILLVGVFLVWRISLGTRVNRQLEKVRASRMPTNPKELDGSYARVSDEENAAVALQGAFAALRNLPGVKSNQVARIKITHLEPLSAEDKADVSEYVKLNVSALAQAAEAVKKPKCRFPVDLSDGFETLLPHLPKVRQLASLASYRAILSVESRAKSNAMQSWRTIFGLARHLECEPLMISQLVRMHVDESAVTALEQTLSAGRFDREELKDLSALFAAAVCTNSLVTSLISERADTLPLFRMKWSDIERFADSEGNVASNKSTHGDSQPWILFASGFFERDMSFYLDSMEKNIEAFQLPLPQRLKAQAMIERQGEDSRKRFYLISSMFLPSLSRLVLREGTDVSRLRLARLAIEIELYRLQHAALPANLDALNLSAESVADPFRNGTLGYKQTAKGFVVYSVGPDGVDDAGKERPKKPKEDEHWDITFFVDR